MPVFYTYFWLREDHREFVNAERLAEDRMSADEYKKYIKEKRV